MAATKYLVEYVLKPGDPGWAESVPINHFKFGPVDFKPNPNYGDRRIVEVTSQEHRDYLLSRSPAGQTLFQEPTDVLNLDLRLAIRREVEAVLDELGIITAPLSNDPAPSDAAEEVAEETPAQKAAKTRAANKAKNKAK